MRLAQLCKPRARPWNHKIEMAKEWQEIIRQELEKDGRTGCEGQLFATHKCIHPVGLPLDINEVLVPKSVFQKMTPSKRMYFYHVYNCSSNCRWFHQRFGHSRAFRDWFKHYVSQRYGGTVVLEWMMDSPLKIKRGR